MIRTITQSSNCFIVGYSTTRVTFSDVNWGSTTQAQTYKNALTSVQQLDLVEEHVKNYRPQILALSGSPSSRPAFIDFANQITKNQSLLICGHIVEVMFRELGFSVNRYVDHGSFFSTHWPIKRDLR